MTLRLDSDQRGAVGAGARGATNVVAGAGTGKTTVLVQRYMKLVREDGIAPDRILALTFTLKAAAEMRHRIHTVLAAEMPHLAESLFGAWIMNFHQFGLRLIRENAPAFGIDPGVDVMSPAQFARIKQVLRRRFLEGRIEGVPHDFGGAMPAPTKMDSRFDLFFDAALACRGDGRDPAWLRGKCTGEDTDGYRAWVESVIAIAAAFEDELVRRNLIDFSAMVAVPARRLLEDDSLRKRYASRFDHILVDEFQDTSLAQFALLEALSDADFSTVTVVGDRKQSIYRWRDARVENVEKFPGEKAPLGVNYRSCQNILDIAYAFICTDDAFEGADDNPPLRAHRGANEYPVVLFHPEAKEDWEAEAEALAAWIRHLTEGHAVDNLPDPPPGGYINVQDVAVLMRSLKPRHGLPYIERAFERHGIPYAVVGGANAAETRALESWHAAMSLLLPGNRARDLLTVLEGAPWNVPDVVLWELVREVKKRPGGMDLLSDDDIARINDPRAADRVRELRAHIADLASRMVSSDFRSFIAWAVDESPLAARLFEGVTSAAASKTVQDLVLEVMDAFDQVSGAERPAGLQAFLDHLRAAIDDRKFREESDVRLPSDRVSVMTIHQSKGLEFPAVAVAGVKPLSGGREHHYLSREHGLYFAARDAGSWQRKPADAPDFTDEQKMEEREANCLFYVAMTRAKDYLWVSSPLCEGKIPGKEKDRVSLFTTLLDCADAVDPLVILRRPPGIAAPAEPAKSDTDVQVNALADALEGWAHARERSKIDGGAPAPSAAALDVVSWPELYAFRECPLRYRYRFRTRVGDVMGTDDEGVNVDREIEEAVAIPKGMAPADYGILVHGALERVFRDGTPAAVAIDQAAAALPDGAVTRKARDAAKTLVQGVLDSDIGTPGHGTATEAPFEVRLDTLVVHGVFDRIERGPDGLRVIDYKVGVEDPAHHFQIQLYAWALSRIDDQPVDGLICYLREKGAVIQHATTPDSAARIEQLAERLQTALRTGDYPATPGSVCTACAYRTVCPSAAVTVG